MVQVKGRKRRRSMPASSDKERKKLFWEDDLGWRDVTPSDSKALLVGSDEGGFMSLEEIDGEVFDGASGLDLETVGGDGHWSEVAKKTSKKRKKVEVKNVVEDLVRTKSVARARKLAKVCQIPPTAVEQEAGEDGSEIDTVAGGVQGVCGLEEGAPAGKRSRKSVTLVEETPELHLDLWAWAHLRLHPLLQKAIAMLGFKEPTPIQNACIPAAAHQGKDVIGAAETGSGKTLAFGIPILQRLLEEQEKARRQDADGVGKEKTGKSRSGFLRALIIAPTRELAMQVSDHLKAVAKFTNLRVVPIVGGMSTQKQARMMTLKPDIVVGTPGRLWELMSEGESHLLDLRALSFFVLDEADRMVEKGHFQELQSIIDLLPKADKLGRKERKEVETSEALVGETEVDNGAAEDGLHVGVPIEASIKRRQTMVFSATLALPENFRKKLKRGFQAPTSNESSLSALSERAGVRHTAAVVDLTSKTVMAQHLEESVLECRDDEKDAFLYYVLKVHGSGRTIVFCTSIAAVRRVSAILRLLQLPLWPLHAQMQQRQRLKAMDRFRDSEYGILVATDVAARGLDIPGIRTVIHYQLPHSAEIYVHRSGRTARAQTDGCSITFVSPSDQRKYAALCKSLSKKDGLAAFPINSDYMPAVERRVSLATQIDKLSRKVVQGQDHKSWLARNAEALELDLEEVDEDWGDGSSHPKSKTGKDHADLKKLQQELQGILKQPLQPKSFSRRYVAGTGMSPLVAAQLQQVVGVKGNHVSNARDSFVVIGEEAMEPLQAFRRSVEAVERGEIKPLRSVVKSNLRNSKPQRHSSKGKKQKQGRR